LLFKFSNIYRVICDNDRHLDSWLHSHLPERSLTIQSWRKKVKEEETKDKRSMKVKQKEKTHFWFANQDKTINLLSYS
jgi:hypothetical protein